MGQRGFGSRPISCVSAPRGVERACGTIQATRSGVVLLQRAYEACSRVRPTATIRTRSVSRDRRSGGFASCSSGPRPPSVYELSRGEPAECRHPVQLFSEGEPLRRYRELARVSVTCPLLAPRACEEKLLARACDLGANAVLIRRSNTTSPAMFRRTKTGREALLVDEAVAVRYER